MNSRRTVHYGFSTFFLVLALSAGRSVEADVNEWTNIGPNTNQVDILTIDPVDSSNIYLVIEQTGVQSGYKSVNHGDSWSAYTLPSSSVSGLAVDPGNQLNLYAGLSKYIFKSTDGGGTWNWLYTAAANYFFNFFAIDSQTPGTMYVFTKFNGVMKSVDGGSNWNAANTGMTASINALSMDPSDHSILYLGTTKGVFKSTDYAGSWTQKNTGLPNSGPYPYVNAVAVNPLNGFTLYAATLNGVYKSIDGGDSWSPALSGLPTYNPNVTSLAIDPLQPARLYAGTISDGVYRSTNAGESWGPVNDGLTNNNIRMVAVDPMSPDNVFTGSDGGLFKITFEDTGLYNLTYTKSGSGYGLVTSSPAGIDCTGNCYAKFTPGAVQLHAATYNNSFFMGWSGACSGVSADCTVTVDSDKAVSASFVLGTEHMVMLEGGAFPTPYYTLQSAYDNAGGDYLMKAMGTLFIENLDCSGDNAVSIKGGYDNSFSGNSGFTTIVGSMTIGGTGSVTVENLIIKG
jgi:photosystem II stability/assembly factor-like uncharacterized protein